MAPKGEYSITHLTYEHRYTSANELPDCPGILIQITAGETLVGAVEKGKMALLYHNIGNCAPLIPCGIHSCGVMGASVEDND